jgi:hypothetical protein
VVHVKIKTIVSEYVYMAIANGNTTDTSTSTKKQRYTPRRGRWQCPGKLWWILQVEEVLQGLYDGLVEGTMRMG